MHKLFGRGDLYCWNCGGRQHVGKKRCPHCGAYYKNSSKPVIRRAKAHPGLGPLHYTVVSYIVKYILFSILFAFGWCCIMYFFMDVTFVDERKYVYVILWGFWLIWLFFWALGKVKDVFKTRAKNAMPGLSVTCAMCGIQLPRNHRFCPDCGTVIFAYHSDSDVITEEEAKNEKLSHKAARKARGVVSEAVSGIAKDAVEQITKSVFGMIVAAVMLQITITSCMPSHSNAQNRLSGALNPTDERYLSADELVALFSDDNVSFSDRMKGSACVLKLPLTDVNTRPKEGLNYVGIGSGSTMKFLLSASADTLSHTVGTVFIDWHESQWGIANHKVYSDTCYVESRGKGVYSLYDVDRLRLGLLLFVYPGADSILIDRGSEETRRIFKINQ